MMGRKLRTRLDVLRPNLGNRIQKRASPIPATNQKARNFAVGDPVLVRDYRGQKESWCRGVVTRKLGPVTYQVQVGDFLWKRHIDQLLLYTGDPHRTPPHSEDTVELDSSGVSPVYIPPVPARVPQVPGPVSMTVDLPAPVPTQAVPDSIQAPTVQTEVPRRYSTRKSVKPARLIENI
jgi:hypothetical protein